MTKRRNTYLWLVTLLLCFIQAAGIAIYAQDRPRAAMKRGRLVVARDSIAAGRGLQPDTAVVEKFLTEEAAGRRDSLAVADSIAAENRRKMLEMTSGPQPSEQPVPTDSLQQAMRPKRWVPNPTKATWLALVIPGAGQIYNRKYWKLPIYYGGFAGCAYALTWNGKMYRDYSNAYREAVNGNWDSSSIQDLLPPGYLDRVSTTQLTETLRRRKDSYRRYRDLSVIAFIGVYLLSVVDAYVDAELSNFDLTPDLSMRLEPAMFDSQTYGISSSRKSVGVQCSLSF